MSSIKLSRNAVIAIIAGNLAVLVLMTLIFLCYFCRRYGRGKAADGKPAKRKSAERTASSSYGRPSYSQQSPCQDRGGLVFLEEPKQFELEDLLRASAEMLGKGTFGSTYRAALDDSSVVVVKRLKDVNAGGRKDFEQHMQLLASFKHANILGLRAYYYARDEKLLVYDYLHNGSLYSLLHGNRGPGRTPLDWNMRMQIALDAAVGLSVLHRSGIVHGNMKSSNILVDKKGNACVTDFGLVGLMNPAMAAAAAVATRSGGYRAPEQSDGRKISEKTDVYSFGVVLLELLTGKNPAQCNIQEAEVEGSAMDLPKWVQSVVREEWTVEVFDLELMRYSNIEEDMVALLQIALTCATPKADQRPNINHVVKMIQNIRPVAAAGGRESYSPSPSLSPSPLSEEP